MLLGLGGKHAGTGLSALRRSCQAPGRWLACEEHMLLRAWGIWQDILKSRQLAMVLLRGQACTAGAIISGMRQWCHILLGMVMPDLPVLPSSIEAAFLAVVREMKRGG